MCINALKTTDGAKQRRETTDNPLFRIIRMIPQRAARIKRTTDAPGGCTEKRREEKRREERKEFFNELYNVIHNIKVNR
jgi:hypothetical protein